MKKKRGSGFTLIELMVVVAVIGILSAIAYPSYSEYVQRSRIAEATSTLGDMRIRQERYFQDNRTYVSAGTTCGATLPAANSFTYACVAATSSTFVATATGTAGMVGFTFSVDQDNVRRTTASPWVAGLPVQCWITRRGESC